MKQTTVVRTLAAAGVIAALAAGGAIHYEPFSAHARNATAAAETAPTPLPMQSLPDFSVLVERYGAAVVNISVVRNVKTGLGARDFDRSDPFFEFFRRFQIPAPEPDVPAAGIGSGFIVSPDGLILTNAHVVADAQEVAVKLTDRREFKAKVLGTDPQTDIAVLRIEAKGLPTVKLGASENVRVGEWVVAIGSPYGFENSVTSGIVSAKSRALPDGTYVPFIQTDVAVNPGNSGGPLFNMKGEVIGINSQIYSRSGGYQGLSFAIPIDVAVKVKDQLVQHGKVTRGRIGVTIQEVNQSLAESFGLKKPMGALVSSVDKDGPAAKAGIEPGDIIVKVDGKEVARSLDLPVYIGDLRPGTSVKLEVWRKGGSREVAVTVSELETARVASAATGDHGHGRIGLAVRPLTQDERNEAHVAGGLLVEDASGPAAKAGIRPGDVVLAVNGAAVKTADDLRRLAARAGKHIAVLVQRDDARIFIPIELG